MIQRYRFIIFAAFALTLSACATDKSFGLAEGIEITNLEQLPAPLKEVTYAIGPREKLQIFVVGAENISGDYLTDDVGNLSFPFLDEVATGGKSPNVAAAMIANGLRGQYLLNPQVRIVPDEVVPPSISIGGQVEKPGSYPAVDNPTLLRVINQAEGLTDVAEHEDVLIMRRVDNQNYIGLYNLRAIERGNYEDPRLYAGDIVMVGDSAARRRLETLAPLIPLASTAAIIIDRLGR